MRIINNLFYIPRVTAALFELKNPKPSYTAEPQIDPKTAAEIRQEAIAAARRPHLATLNVDEFADDVMIKGISKKAKFKALLGHDFFLIIFNFL